MNDPFDQFYKFDTIAKINELEKFERVEKFWPFNKTVHYDDGKWMQNDRNAKESKSNPTLLIVLHKGNHAPTVLCC